MYIICPRRVHSFIREEDSQPYTTSTRPLTTRPTPSSSINCVAAHHTLDQKCSRRFLIFDVKVELLLGQVVEAAASRGLERGTRRRRLVTLGKRIAGKVVSESRAPLLPAAAARQGLPFDEGVGNPCLRALRDRRVARAVVAAAVETLSRVKDEVRVGGAVWSRRSHLFLELLVRAWRLGESRLVWRSTQHALWPGVLAQVLVGDHGRASTIRLLLQRCRSCCAQGGLGEQRLFLHRGSGRRGHLARKVDCWQEACRAATSARPSRS